MSGPVVVPKRMLASQPPKGTFRQQKRPHELGAARPSTAVPPLWQSPRMHAMGRSATAGAATTSQPTVQHAAAQQPDDLQDGDDPIRYWQGVMAKIKKPVAKTMRDKLELHLPMGFSKPSKGKVPTMQQTVLDFKKKHPTKVIITRCGDFYEAWGTDAVIMVEYGGYNPMGNRNPPQAGCPKQNIHRLLQDLVDAGFSVAVGEEEEDKGRYGIRQTKAKKRFISQVVSPARRNYLYGYINEKSSVALEPAAPLLGLAREAGAYVVMQLNQEFATVSVTGGLTEEAVNARLHEGGLAPPLYLHSSITEGTGRDRWVKQMEKLCNDAMGAVERFSGPDPVESFLSAAKRGMGLDANTTIRQVRPKDVKRPKPLYACTAGQLGLHTTRYIPSLLDAMLPPAAHRSSRLYLEDLLLLPPPPDVAASIREACRQLSGLEQPLPGYPPLARVTIAEKLRARETSAYFFRELRAAVSAAEETLSRPDLGGLAAALLPPTSFKTGLELSQSLFLRSCREAIMAIDEVIHDPTGHIVQPVIEEEFFEEDGTEEDSDGGDVVDPIKTALERLFRQNEQPFRNRVLQHLIKEEYNAVAEAFEEVEKEVTKAFQPFHRPELGNLPVTKRAMVVHDKSNNAVWIKIPKGSPAEGSLKDAQQVTGGMTRPRDRNGSLVKDRWATPGMEDALQEYRLACQEAGRAVHRLLRSLASRLEMEGASLVAASMFCNIAAALDSHVGEARRRGWCLPTQIVAGEGETPVPINVQGMWPYWKEPASRRTETVHNDLVDMHSMYLLTGPNMAGKSTVLRSTAAVALLGTVGLHAPAMSAQLPYLDAIMLRTFSSDNPLEGNSSFAVEMLEMKYVLDDATKDSLVLLDELGKGTEVDAGTGLAAAFLQWLDDTHCKGIFATHLHKLLDLPLRTRHMVRMCMETESDPTGHYVRATWRMGPGQCTNSLALSVALSAGIQQSLVDEAQRMTQLLRDQQSRVQGQYPSAYRENSISSPAFSSGGFPAPALRPDSSPPWSAYGGGNGSAYGSQGGSQWGASSQGSNTAPGWDTPAPELPVAGHAAAIRRMVFTDDSLPSPRHPDEPYFTPEAVLEKGIGYAKEATMAVYQQIMPSGVKLKPLNFKVVAPTKQPPASTVGKSCLYLCVRRDGWGYCGQTDDVRQRIKVHRSKSGKFSGGSDMLFAYLVLPDDAGGSSAAKAMETATINMLKLKQWKVLYDGDASGRLTPTRG